MDFMDLYGVFWISLARLAGSRVSKPTCLRRPVVVGLSFCIHYIVQFLNSLLPLQYYLKPSLPFNNFLFRNFYVFKPMFGFKFPDEAVNVGTCWLFSFLALGFLGVSYHPNLFIFYEYPSFSCFFVRVIFNIINL